MTHQKLLIGMIGLLFAASGGVFVLVYQGSSSDGGEIAEIPRQEVQQIDPSSLVAGVSEFAEEENKQETQKQVQPRLTPPSQVPVPASAPVEKININTASLEELDQITGVGPAIAQRIIDYRNQHGLFQTIEEIKDVSGIGDVNFEKMKDEITVGNVAPASSPPPPPPIPTPAPAPSPSPQPEGHTFYTSSYWSSKLYYCDTDSAWKNLSEKYLESYPSEDAVLAKYPKKTLHEPCT